MALALALVALPAGAAGGKDLAEQRALFLKAEAALEAGDRPGFQKLEGQLSDYPLLPYLDYQRLLADLPELGETEFEAFAAQAADTPLVSPLRSRWLDHLARRSDWKRYTAVYRPGAGTERECRFITALLALGERERALGRVEGVWLSGTSQPKACDPVFDAWRKAGRLTDDLVWKRVELAFERRNTGLARYLRRYLSEGEQPWLDLWLRVHRKPGETAHAKAFAQDHPYRTRILVYGLERLAAREPERARSTWIRVRDLYRFEPAQVYGVERRIALAGAKKDWATGRDWLGTLEPADDDASLHEQRVRLALGEKDWARVRDWIRAMPAALGATERWRYWLARSLETTGAKDEARELFVTLSGERDYDGFLAADRVGRDYHLAHIPLEPPAERVAEVAAIPALARAGELFALDRPIEARREWWRVLDRLSGDKPALQAAAKLAQEWGWHDQAIFTLARTGYWDDLELRFPLQHSQAIDGAAKRRELPNSWVYAVVRQESAFSRDARSPAGALGLMQLMPRTARAIAREIKHPKPRRKDLFEPDTNITLGTAYLDRVLERFEGNSVLATAAYNAGPSRVARWLPEETVPADLWVETIPFSETRSYVQRVFAYRVIYDRRQGREPERLQALMPPVAPLASGSSKVAGI
jgi:soluble lytic murein transglycosylase